MRYSHSQGRQLAAQYAQYFPQQRFNVVMHMNAPPLAAARTAAHP
jgi:hypothetical protein